MTLREIYFKVRFLIKAPFLYLRNVECGKGIFIEPRVFIANTTIGSYSYIGHNCVIDKASIGNYCSIAAFTQIGGMEHSHWWWSTSPRLSSLGVKNETNIGHDVWIGSKVSLKQGIKIGNGAVIGSNSVVLHDVEPYTIVAGVPAKILKKRFTATQIEELESTQYYLQDPSQAKAILNRISPISGK